METLAETLQRMVAEQDGIEPLTDGVTEEPDEWLSFVQGLTGVRVDPLNPFKKIPIGRAVAGISDDERNYMDYSEGSPERAWLDAIGYPRPDNMKKESN